jgi:hypothetical protein
MKFISAASLAILVAVSTSFVAEARVPGEPAAGQVVTKTKRTTRNVSHKTKVTTKRLSGKTWRGTKRVAHKSRVKSQPVRKKTWRTGRATGALLAGLLVARVRRVLPA